MKDLVSYERAELRAKAKFGFYIHLIVYVTVILILFIVNTSTSSEYFWVKWPIMGWGIAILFHALRVYVIPGEPKVPERMIERELEKEEVL
jgi:hypothetical protein